MRYQFGHSLLRTMALVVGLLNLAAGAVWAVFVLYAVAPGPMGLDAIGFSLLLTTSAVGTVAGTFLAGVFERRLGKPNLLALCIVVLALEHLVLALSANPYVVGAVLAIGGLVLGAFNPVFVSLRMRIVPGQLLGRVVASFRLLGMGTLPVGALLGGLIAEAFGAPGRVLRRRCDHNRVVARAARHHGPRHRSRRGRRRPERRPYT